MMHYHDTAMNGSVDKHMSALCQVLSHAEGVDCDLTPMYMSDKSGRSHPARAGQDLPQLCLGTFSTGTKAQASGRLRRLGLCAFLAIPLFLSGLSVSASDLEKKEVHGYPLYTIFEPSLIPAVFEPFFIDVHQAQELYHPDEPLIVVSDGSDTHAYSLWHLEEHIVVNDVINGKAITATW